MTELLDSIRVELRTRLDELRPLVREYNGFKTPKRHSDGSPKQRNNASAS